MKVSSYLTEMNDSSFIYGRRSKCLHVHAKCKINTHTMRSHVYFLLLYIHDWWIVSHHITPSHTKSHHSIDDNLGPSFLEYWIVAKGFLLSSPISRNDITHESYRVISWTFFIVPGRFFLWCVNFVLIDCSI